MYNVNAAKNTKASVPIEQGMVSTMPASEAYPSHDSIRDRAYELYEQRGREDGREQQDWFKAEHEMRVRK
jgi:Protein of unknown function (DUF2934)